MSKAYGFSIYSLLKIDKNKGAVEKKTLMRAVLLLNMFLILLAQNLR